MKNVVLIIPLFEILFNIVPVEKIKSNILNSKANNITSAEISKYQKLKFIDR